MTVSCCYYRLWKTDRIYKSDIDERRIFKREIAMELKHFTTDQNEIINNRGFQLFIGDGFDFSKSRQEDEHVVVEMIHVHGIKDDGDVIQ